MKKVRKIAFLLSLFLMNFISLAFSQNVRYVNVGSTHALSIPENPDYRFHWSMYFETPDQGVAINTTTHVTENIYWDKLGVYYVQVFPEDRETGCLGEPIYLRVHTVHELSLHAKNDLYITPINTPVSGDVSLNDFELSGSVKIYNPTPVVQPQNGTVSINAGGHFTYRPNQDFVGTDQFVYEVCNNNNPVMCATATVTIIVIDGGSNADVGIEKDGPEKILSNTEITYTLRVYNEGPADAHNVVVQDSLPFGIFRPQYSMNDGNSWDPFNFTITIPELKTKEEQVILIKGWVSPNSPQWLYNQAETWADEWDVYLKNNISGTIRTRVYHDVFAEIPVDTMFVPTCEFGILDGSESRSHASIVKWDWWPNGPDHIIDPANDTIGIFFPTNLSDTSLYIHLTVTNADGFSDTDSVFVIVPLRPEAIAAQGTQTDTAWIDIGEVIDLNGLMSSGDSIRFKWETDFGLIKSGQDSVVVQVGDVGEYFLTVTDKYNCPVHDTILVLLESHPPIAINDTMWTISLVNDTVNVLDNDYDINNFNLTVTAITQNPHHGTVTWQPNGEAIYVPTEYYIGVDSFRYRVCNDGLPVQCSEAWVIVNVERPPLNADVAIEKTGPVYGFYGDTITYNLLVSNNGPDTPSVVNIIEDLPRGLRTPQYSLNGGLTWTNIDDTIKVFNLIPGDLNAELILVRGALSSQAQYVIDNKAWIQTNILENNIDNDTADWSMWVKEPVVAEAGNDFYLGACFTDTLDATKSTGENISYRWEALSPHQSSNYLSNPNSPNPVFNPFPVNNGFIITYVLTVTDQDNNIPGYFAQDKDTIVITVVDPPHANAGPDVFLEQGETVGLDGTGSSGAGLSYQWTTDGGRFVGSSATQYAIVDSIGDYTLTVTDSMGCTDQDEATVFQFFYPPFAVDDYYSIEPGQTLNANVMDNDLEPNGRWGLKVVSVTGQNASQINIAANGEFTFRTNTQGVYKVTYEVCNNAPYVQCATADVYISVYRPITSGSADLELTKIALEEEYLIGSQIDYQLKIKNNGPEVARSVMVSDVFSEFVRNPEYRYLGGSQWSDWPADSDIGPFTMDPGDSLIIELKGTVALETPALLFNDAVVYSNVTFDPLDTNNYDWVIVNIRDELIAKAEAETDAIGTCNSVLLDGTGSKSTSDIRFFWSPAANMNDPESPKPRFFPGALSDTLVTIYLTVTNESGSTSRDSVQVYVGPQVIANAGPDYKINRGGTISIDGSASSGDELSYFWQYFGDGQGIVGNPNQMQIIARDPGRYLLRVTDKYGCSSVDEVFVRYNRLEAVNDIAIVKKNKSFLGNVLTNDFDPDFDNITVQHLPLSGSRFTSSGQLLNNPPMVYNELNPAPNGHYIANDGSFLYQPNENFVGDDYFDYVIFDDNVPSLFDTARVFIKVVEETPFNNPPVANNDEVFVEEGQRVSGNVLNNDYDFDGGIVNLRVESNTNPLHGTLEINPDGSFSYIPFANFIGLDQFEYMVCDNGIPEACATALVFIHVLPSDANNAPIAVDDAYYSVDRPVYGNVLINDHDPDEGDLIWLDTALVFEPMHADSFIIFENGDFIYWPSDDFNGTDFFVYEICDDHPVNPLCANGTAYITVFDSLFADPEVKKEGPEWILSGDVIQYTITVKNEGPSLANDLIVKDIVDPRLQNVQYSSAEFGGWRNWNNELFIDQMKPNPNSGFEYVFQIRADLPVEMSGDLCNTVTVEHGMNDTDFDRDGDNNTSTWCTKVYQQVIADAGPDTVIGSCTDDFYLSAAGTVGMDSITYDWRPARYLDDGTSRTPLFIPDATDTTYLFILTVTGVVSYIDDDGNTVYNNYEDKDTVRISVLYEPVAYAHPNDSSYVTVQEIKDGYRLDGSQSIGAGLTYQWWRYDAEDEIEVIADSVFARIYEYDTYYLTVIDSAGCTDVASLFVTYDPIEPHAEDDSLVTTIMNTPVMIPVVVGWNPAGADWDQNNDLDTASILVTQFPQFGQVIAHPESGSFEYIPNDFKLGRDRFTYQIWDKTGLSDDAMVSIEILEAPPKVSEGFSPNSDGINDFLYIENIHFYSNNKIMIFNRWGAKLYEKEHYSNDDPWNGIATMGIRIGSGVVPTGTYYYILDLGDGQGVFTGEFYIAAETRR